MLNYLRTLFDKWFPPCIPTKCDRCKNDLNGVIVSSYWGNYNYICTDCLRYAEQFGKQDDF